MTENHIQASEDVSNALKLALRGMAQSVVVIATVDGEGTRYAMAATAVTALSMDPPSMLICVNRTASSHPVLSGGADFSLNILAADQIDVAQSCGGGAKGDERFATGQWNVSANGLPYLADAETVIHCVQRQRYSYGSHDIFIGDVHAVQVPNTVDPLIYLNGAYHRIGPAV